MSMTQEVQWPYLQMILLTVALCTKLKVKLLKL